MIPTDISLVDEFLRLVPAFKVSVDQINGAVLESLAELEPWMTWASDDYQPSFTSAWQITARAGWQQGVEFQFAILDAADGKFLGGSGLNHLNPQYRFANLGYWVRTSATRHGVASRAARLVARFGFEQLGLVRAEIVVAQGNLPSLMAAHKAGALREGLLRHRLWTAAGLEAAYMHSLVPEDFEISLAQVNETWERRLEMRG